MSEIEKRDSDSVGEQEKGVVPDTENGHQTLNTLPDPDTGLGDEERAKIVSSSSRLFEEKI